MKAVDDNINIYINEKSEDVENEVKSQNDEETSEDVANENFIRILRSHQSLLRWKNPKGVVSWLFEYLCGYGRGSCGKC